MGEFELIERYFARLGPARADVALGPGDDAALLEVPPGAELVASVDTMVAGRHFPADSDAKSLGHRALAVNLSDLAAMGATPAWALLAITLPSADAAWLEGFATGFAALAERHGVALVGGNTTAGPLNITVQILGYVPRGTALLRSGASAGDLLAVTGALGDAGAGLALTMGSLVPDGVTTLRTEPPICGDESSRGSAVREEAAAFGVATAHVAAGFDDALARALRARFEYPTPRVEFGIAARGLASAAMDISDGLVGDLPKLARASALGARIEVERLPVSRALAAVAGAERARAFALGGGEDYELLVALAPRRLEELAEIARRLNLTLTVIGELCRGSDVCWSLEGREFAPDVRGFDHFR